MIVYFSNVSGYTHRFVEKLGLPAIRIPLNAKEAELLTLSEEFVLITPTYGASGKGFVPKQVIKFLNNPENRSKLRGVIGSGSLNFLEDYTKAADIISGKCNVPILYRFELSGTDEDVANTQEGLNSFWEIK